LVGVTLDTGHLVAAGESPAGVLRTLAGRLFNVHLKDVALTSRLERWLFRRPRMEGCTVGDGDAGLPAFLRALAGSGYAGCVAIEDERPDVALSELQASLRETSRILRAVSRPLQA